MSILLCVFSFPLFYHLFLGKSTAVLLAELLRGPHGKSLANSHVSLEADPLSGECNLGWHLNFSLIKDLGPEPPSQTVLGF
jgi:hypothetical protein